MTDWNKFILSSELAVFIDLETDEQEWLGNPPATEAQIAQLENRLGVRLPPSYREFLQFSNGWLGTEETDAVPKLLPVDKVDLFIKLSPHEVNAWQLAMTGTTPPTPEEYRQKSSDPNYEDFPLEFLQTAIQINEPVDNVYVLLIPDIVQDQEYETWAMAAWMSGSIRFPSFWHFMQNEYQFCVDQYTNNRFDEPE